MKKNVGDVDGYFRIWAGLFMLGLGIREDSTTLMALGAGKVAEGVTKFCPMLYLLGISTSEKEIKSPVAFRPLRHRS